jgi:hypothetical protein
MANYYHGAELFQCDADIKLFLDDLSHLDSTWEYADGDSVSIWAKFNYYGGQRTEKLEEA